MQFHKVAVLDGGVVKLEKIALIHADALYPLLNDQEVLATLTIKRQKNVEEMRKFIQFCERDWELNND